MMENASTETRSFAIETDNLLTTISNARRERESLEAERMAAREERERLSVAREEAAFERELLIAALGEACELKRTAAIDAALRRLDLLAEKEGVGELRPLILHRQPSTYEYIWRPVCPSQCLCARAKIRRGRLLVD